MHCAILKIYKNEKLARFLCASISSRQNVVSFDEQLKTPLGEKAVLLNENTLTGRLLFYFQNENQSKFKNYKNNCPLKHVQNSFNKSVLTEALNLNIKKVDRFNVTDIVNAILNLNQQPKFNSREILDTLDNICETYVVDLSTEELFYILQAYMKVISNRITHLKFYKAAILQIQRNIQYCTKNEILQLMFYTSLDKKLNRFKFVMKQCLKQLDKIEALDDMNLNELCIVCYSSFKTSTKIINCDLLEKVKQAINNDLSILKDPALFITLVKTMRHNKYQDDDILNTITCTILFNKTMCCYSFCAVCHILALYSDPLYYDEHILKLCVENGIKLLREYKKGLDTNDTYNTEIIRMKDITRFLWAISHIGYENFDANWCRELITPIIIHKIKTGEYKCDVESIGECILYMWMLDYKAYELFSYVLTPMTVNLIRRQKSRCKYRLNLLLAAMQFEDRETFKKLNIKPQGENYDLNYQINNRPMLIRIYENLKNISKTLPINAFELNFQIPYLNVVGITGFKNNAYKAVNIEVLDDYTSVRNRVCYPSGLMQLKLRILRNSQEPVITICQHVVEDLNDTELQNYLKEELEFV